jgi:hypothetical protein
VQVVREDRNAKSAGEDMRGSVAYDSLGGCQPTLTHNRRATTMSSVFSFNANPVARPHGVTPMSCVPVTRPDKMLMPGLPTGMK